MKMKAVTNKEYKRIMSGKTERSLDRTFGKVHSWKRYPYCMRNPNPLQMCRLCTAPREKIHEIMKGLCRKCYQLSRHYKNKDLIKLAVARIKLAKLIHVRP